MATVARSAPQEVPYLQALLGWAALAVILASVLALGANRPVAWTLMSMAVLPIFIVQVTLDAFRGVPAKATLVWPAALLYLGALVWGYIQTFTGVGPGVAHPIWSLVPGSAAAISADPLAGQHHVMRLATYGMVFWIALRASLDVDRALLFLKAFALFSAALAAFGLYAWFIGSNPILDENASNVVSASFINRNSYATFAVFGAVACLALYLQSADDDAPDDGNSGRKLRNFIESFYGGGWIFALGFLLCLGGVILSQSRAGFAALLIGLATFGLVSRRRESGKNPFIMGLIAVILLFAIIALSSGLFSRMLATSDEDGRFLIYGPVLSAMMERPILGHGLGAFHDTFRAHVPLQVANVEWDLAHSSYFENFYEFGFPAAIAFYASLLFVAGTLLRGCLTRRRHRIFASVAFACLAAGAFHSFFDFSLQMPASAAVFAFLLGMGWAQAFRRERRRNA